MQTDTQYPEGNNAKQELKRLQSSEGCAGGTGREQMQTQGEVSVANQLRSSTQIWVAGHFQGQIEVGCVSQAGETQAGFQGQRQSSFALAIFLDEAHDK